MKKEEGFALIFSLIMMILIIFIVMGFSVTASNDLSLANKARYSMNAYYIAEAGIARKFMEIRSNVVGNNGDITNPQTVTLNAATNDSGTFTVHVGPPTVAGTYTGYKLDSTGLYKGVHKIVSMTIRQESWTRFGYLSNNEDMISWGGTSPIWFTTGDVLSGPVSSNDQFNISGDPIFNGPVTSAASSINYYHDDGHGNHPGDDPVFNKSLSLGIPVTQMPAVADTIDAIRTKSQQTGGVNLTGDTTITLKADGTMNVTNKFGKKTATTKNMALPTNGALFVGDGDVFIGDTSNQSTLNGQLTIVAGPSISSSTYSNNIYIVNNIKYNTDPRPVGSTSTDTLGIISQNNVYVDATAPSNLEIDAYMLALNKSFVVESYDSIPKGTLTLYGGVTQDTRGPVGTFDGHTGLKLDGYTKAYTYDARLENTPPPNFPISKDNLGNPFYYKTEWTENADT